MVAVAITASPRDRGRGLLIFAADFDRLRVLFKSQSTPMQFVDARPAPGPEVVLEASGEKSVTEVVCGELAAALRPASASG